MKESSRRKAPVAFTFLSFSASSRLRDSFLQLHDRATQFEGEGKEKERFRTKKVQRDQTAKRREERARKGLSDETFDAGTAEDVCDSSSSAS